MTQKNFAKALLKAVDFAFNSLGSSCNRALYFHLDVSFQIKKREIPNKIEMFDRALKLIFKGGAVFLEKLILKKLCQELNVEFEQEEDFDFVKTISKIENTVLKESFFCPVLPPKKNLLLKTAEKGTQKTNEKKETTDRLYI